MPQNTHRPPECAEMATESPADPERPVRVPVRVFEHAAESPPGVSVCRECHGSKFGKAARRLGLVGPLTATEAGPATVLLLAPILAQLGTYPHARIDLSTIKRQGTRMVLVKCPADECGYQVRTTQKWLNVGLPTCPCGELMEAAGSGDPDLEVYGQAANEAPR